MCVIVQNTSNIRSALAYGRAALLGKALIVVIATDAVGVTLHVQLETRMPGDDAGNLRQLLARRGP